MGRHRRVAILLTEDDQYPRRQGHFIWAMRRFWEANGVEVIVLKGVAKTVDADLLIPHIDLTIIPQGYVSFFNRYPRVVNRDLLDISKRRISLNLLGPADPYDGAVIVKTNLNCGGFPEARSNERSPVRFRHSWLKRFFRSSVDWEGVECIDAADYQVFRSLREVPEAVFRNPALVVEKFLPEFSDGLYRLRIYQFFGDRAYCALLSSREPVVKMRSIVAREEVPIPDEIEAIRRAHGLDYGKLDFVMRDGRAILFDVNRTPGRIKPETRFQANAERLAPGLYSFF